MWHPLDFGRRWERRRVSPATRDCLALARLRLVIAGDHMLQEVRLPILGARNPNAGGLCNRRFLRGPEQADRVDQTRRWHLMRIDGYSRYFQSSGSWIDSRGHRRDSMYMRALSLKWPQHSGLIPTIGFFDA